MALRFRPKFLRLDLYNGDIRFGRRNASDCARVSCTPTGSPDSFAPAGLYSSHPADPDPRKGCAELPWSKRAVRWQGGCSIYHWTLIVLASCCSCDSAILTASAHNACAIAGSRAARVHPICPRPSVISTRRTSHEGRAFENLAAQATAERPETYSTLAEIAELVVAGDRNAQTNWGFSSRFRPYRYYEKLWFPYFPAELRPFCGQPLTLC